MKMNQNLRDFSDRHFEVVFLEWLPKQLGYKHHPVKAFERYDEASQFQKGLIRHYKDRGLGLHRGFPVGQFVRNYAVMGSWDEGEV